MPYLHELMDLQNELAIGGRYSPGKKVILEKKESETDIEKQTTDKISNESKTPRQIPGSFPFSLGGFMEPRSARRCPRKISSQSLFPRQYPLSVLEG
jgi:hypothetical protein